MTLAETRLVGVRDSLQVSPTEIEIGPPKIYTADHIKDGFLTVELAGGEHKLPIKTNEHGIPFTWLNPKETPGMQRACALETGFRLAKKMERQWAIVLEAPSKKSTEMASDAVAVATSLTRKKILEVQLGGETTDHLTDFFDEETVAILSAEQLENGQISETRKVTLLDGQATRVIHYKPITGKDKFKFITEELVAKINERINFSALTVIEDVVSKGTTTRAMRQLLNDEGITKTLEIISVAREGEWVPADTVDFAIQLPLL